MRAVSPVMIPAADRRGSSCNMGQRFRKDASLLYGDSMDLLSRFLELLQRFLPAVLVLFACLPAHEFAHAYVADKLGDPTPRRDGRLTLNPFAHLDPLGSLCLIFVGFGWAKPVVINPFNLDRKKGSMALVAIAGPVANLIMMLIFSLIARLLMLVMVSQWVLFAYSVCMGISYINLCLAVFNLIPVPPLDGSKILYHFLPPRISFKVQQNEYIISLVFMALLILGNTGVLAFGIGDLLGLIINPVWDGLCLLLGTSV